MSDFKQVGVVETLRLRVYPLDPVAVKERTEAIVQPGMWPLYYDGMSRVWIMDGTINGNGLSRGDGLFLLGGGETDTGLGVRIPSKFFGTDDWQALLADPCCIEGSPEQRLRVIIK